MKTLENWIKEALNHWKESETKLRPPAVMSDIEHTESILGFNFPDDFKQLYLIVDGFEDWDMQAHLFSFWPLGRIIEEYNEDDNKSFVGFSDWLIRCSCIGFMKGAPG